ncbi:adenylate/guanylate cyclase domain-containing protein [Albimonas sp. CAU 1670]|uniref:adenylate/guanylate cyclase domain-containing protein n=1 Tax=Albimonas sp. CAU 1670 TaxID=3032599 RepID=UPI0023DCC2E1|nr:adenylate/guanylate cyclase domain-containing protein [Albimonas sp. CAU 1670]MDF2232835.1 adenylate/guanylate cyclase domain-containing protein [Albimonas sp. CAU 1670]
MTHTPLTDEVESWLLDQALHDPDIVELFGDLCLRLHALGIPLQRAALSWPTLHPLFQAEQIYWRQGEAAELFQFRHDAERSKDFERSPFMHALTNRLDRLRRRLEGPETMIDFPVLEDLHEKGFTDYLLTSTRFRVAEVDGFRGGDSGIMASWSTTRPGGFSDGDIEALSRVQRVFAVACHASIQKRVMVNLADAYLGATAAKKALGGDVRRGDGERIRAVVWHSDLRRSTRLSNEMPPEDYLDLLKSYYDCTAQPVIDEGGEILEFIGDAVLAIFPIRGDTGGPEAVRAAVRAMERTLDLREAWIAAAPEGGRERMNFSIAMSVGEVMFGNIGVPARLTFSAIGPAVNKVARLDEMSKELGRMVLVTREVAQVEPERWVSVGPQSLRDFDHGIELFTRACARDAFVPVKAAS